MKVRTSASHPLVIDSVSVSGGGQIGMTLFPGRNDARSLSGPWQRDVKVDLDVIEAWKPDLMVTLLELHEFTLLGQPDFEDIVGRRNWKWCRLAIPDGGVPDDAFEQAWKSVGSEARAILASGGKILLHCGAGLGRTGMIAARLLVELGSRPDDAIRMVREARPRAIETRAQERYIRSLLPVASNPVRDGIAGVMLDAVIGDIVDPASAPVEGRRSS